MPEENEAVVEPILSDHEEAVADIVIEDPGSKQMETLVEDLTFDDPLGKDPETEGDTETKAAEETIPADSKAEDTSVPDAGGKAADTAAQGVQFVPSMEAAKVAQTVGFPVEMATQFKDEASFRLAVLPYAEKFDREHGFVPEGDKAAPAGPVEFKIDLDREDPEGVDERIIDQFNSMRDHYNSQFQAMQSAFKQMSASGQEMQAHYQNQQRSAMTSKVETFAKTLDPGIAEKFSTPEALAELEAKANVLAAGYMTRPPNERPQDVEEIFVEAANILSAGTQLKIATEKVEAKRRAHTGRFAPRPSASSQTAGMTPTARAEEAVGKILAAQGMPLY